MVAGQARPINFNYDREQMATSLQSLGHKK